MELERSGGQASLLCSTLHRSLELETFNCSDKSLFHFLAAQSAPLPLPAAQAGVVEQRTREKRRHLSSNYLPLTRRAIPVLVTTKQVLEHCGGVMEATGIGLSDKE